MRVGSVLMLGTTDLNANRIYLDADEDTYIVAAIDDRMDIFCVGVGLVLFRTASIAPNVTNDVDLGTSSLPFKTGYIPSHIATTRMGLPVVSGNPANNGDISINTSNKLLVKMNGTVYQAQTA